MCASPSYLGRDYTEFYTHTGNQGVQALGDLWGLWLKVSIKLAKSKSKQLEWNTGQREQQRPECSSVGYASLPARADQRALAGRRYSLEQAPPTSQDNESTVNCPETWLTFAKEQSGKFHLCGWKLDSGHVSNPHSLPLSRTDTAEWTTVMGPREFPHLGTWAIRTKQLFLIVWCPLSASVQRI